MPTAALSRAALLTTLITAMSGLAVTNHAAAEAPAAPVRVLVVFGCQPMQPVCADSLAAMADQVARPEWQPAELYVEHLDVARLGPPSDPEAWARQLSAKYASRPPTVIVSDGDEAARLLLGYGEGHWASVPRVAYGLREPRPDVAGVIQLTRREALYRPAETVAAAFRMLPGTRRVVYVGGAGPVDRAGVAICRDEMRRKLPNVPVDEVVGLPLAETLRRVSILPPDDSWGRHRPTASSRRPTGRSSCWPAAPSARARWAAS